MADTKEVKTASAEASVSSAGATTTTKKVRTTTVVQTFEHSDDSWLRKERYRPMIQPKNVFIQRGNPHGQLGGFERSVRYSLNQTASSATTLALIEKAGMTGVMKTRQQEKKDMQDLNERFADYIEKVRFLEAQNRRLADELEKLKSKWGKETTVVKVMYEAEVAEARRLLDEANGEKGRLQLRLVTVEEELQSRRSTFDDIQKAYDDERERGEKLIHKISDIEGEILMLRRRAQNHDSDRDKDKRLIQLLKGQLQVARTDLDKQTVGCINAENTKQTLEEELNFIKIVHEQEMKELAALAYRDTTSENREYWKSEMGQSLREIQQSYDNKIDGMRLEMEATYSLQIQQFAAQPTTDTTYYVEEKKKLTLQLATLHDKISRLDIRNASLLRELEALRHEKEDVESHLTAHNTQLRAQIVDLQSEREAIMREIEQIERSKVSLEAEIEAYRQLLEGAEFRNDRGPMIEYVTPVSRNDRGPLLESITPEMSGNRKPAVGELSAKTTYQRSARGPISIAEISAEGKFVQLENTGQKEEDIGEWLLKRNIDGEDKISFQLPKGLMVKPGNKIKIWAKGAKPADAGPGDSEFDQDSWGSGKDVTTKLINRANEERASHVQKTTFA